MSEIYKADLYKEISEILTKGIDECTSFAEFEAKYIVPLLSILLHKIKNNAQENSQDSLQDSCKLPREEIRANILHFFSKRGLSVIVIFKKDGTLKLTKKIKDISKTPYFTQLLAWLYSNKVEFENSCVKKEFSQKEVLKISQKTDEIIDFSDELLRRDLIRTAIKACFGFDVRDAIFMFDNRASVKNFDYDFVRLNNEIRELSRMPRIEPLLDSALHILKASLKDVDLDALFRQITDEVLLLNTPLKSTKNIDFVRLFPFFIRQKMRLHLEQFWGKNLSRQEKNLFCEHLFRANIKTIYSHVVLELLSKCIAKEKEASNFIDFFNGKLMFLANHKRIKRPVIRDLEGKIYDSEAIYHLVQNRQYIANEIKDLQIRINDLKNSKDGLNEREEKLKNELIKHKSEHGQIEHELEKIALEIKNLKSKGKGHNDELVAMTDKENALLTKNHTALLAINELNEALEIAHQEKRRLPENIKSLERKIAQKVETSRALFAEYEKMKSALLETLISFQITE